MPNPIRDGEWSVSSHSFGRCHRRRLYVPISFHIYSLLSTLSLACHFFSSQPNWILTRTENRKKEWTTSDNFGLEITLNLRNSSSSFFSPHHLLPSSSSEQWGKNIRANDCITFASNDFFLVSTHSCSYKRLYASLPRRELVCFTLVLGRYKKIMILW